MLTRAWKALAITSNPEENLAGAAVSIGEPGGDLGDTTIGEVAAESRKLPLVLSKLQINTQNHFYHIATKFPCVLIIYSILEAVLYNIGRMIHNYINVESKSGMCL